MTQLKYTKEIRSVMRELGMPNWGIWTNKHKHCRTVKCYAPRGVVESAALRKALEKVVKTIPGATLKRIQPPMRYAMRQADSIIVRIPMEAFE